MLVVAKVRYFPRNIVPRGMVSMAALRFQSFSLFSPFTRERKRFENVLKTFQNTLKCVSISFRLGIVFGRCRVNDSSKRYDFVPFRFYFVVV